MEIAFEVATHLKNKPNEAGLGFGKFFTDYMFEMDYIQGQGWINPTIKPYGPVAMDPSTMVLHYGQSVFEGLKAYINPQKQINLFRPEANIKRLNNSCERMCIPQLDEAFVMQAMTALLQKSKDWIPTAKGTSLYIRPFVFATDPYVGVSASKTYKFFIILSPVGAYYAEGFNPVSIYVEQNYVRAVRGGVGEAKTAANYAASIKAQSLAKEKGFSQVLWLDGIEQKYVEEVGTMNVFFKINGEVITPILNGSILEGITRSSIITLLKGMGYVVNERRIAIDEIIQAQKLGLLEEVFGTGTAAVISPVGEMFFEEQYHVIKDGKVGPLSQKLYDTLTQIQTGVLEDAYGWVTTL